jgi:AraC family transcriptional regulator, transcriptional activator FtrA
MSWVRAHAGPRTTLLSICAGAKNLADTGLLAGHKATTHHYTFPVIAKAHPDVQLVRGVRYVEEGNTITSAGVTTGVDATLFALKRVLGDSAALEVARQIVYPYARFLNDPTYEPPVAALNGSMVPPLSSLFVAAYNLSNSQLGVALYPGISELALASVVDTFPHDSTLTVNTVAPERAVVLSSHGLALIPRWSFADAPRLDRIILPGIAEDTNTTAAFEAWANQRSQPPIEQLHQAGGYVYDVTFNEMARNAGSAVANQAVYLLEYPLGRVTVDAPLFPSWLLARVAGLSLLGLGLALLIERRRANQKQRRATRAQVAAS